MKRKAVAVIYSPKTLLDFIWYYVTYGQDYEWDVIVVPYGDDVEQIQPYLESSGIFKKIVVDDKTEKFQSIGDKIKQFICMLGYFIVGRQKIFCKKYVNQRVKIDEYSLVVIPTTHMMLTGILIALSDEYATVILEDGIGDYSVRKEKFDKKDLFDFWNLIGYMLAKMGYANTHRSNYRLEKTKYCDKFSTKPDYMKYRNFKSISKLNDMDNCDNKLYRKILNRMYILPDDVEFVDVVLCTAPLAGFVENKFDYVGAIEKYINENYQNSVILLKKHPRDLEEYKFDSSIRVINIEKTIPAELLLTYFTVGMYVFTWPSAFLFSLDNKKNNLEVLFFEQMDNDRVVSLFYECMDTLDISLESVVKID